MLIKNKNKVELERQEKNLSQRQKKKMLAKTMELAVEAIKSNHSLIKDSSDTWKEGKLG